MGFRYLRFDSMRCDAVWSCSCWWFDEPLCEKKRGRKRKREKEKKKEKTEGERYEKKLS